MGPNQFGIDPETVANMAGESPRREAGMNFAWSLGAAISFADRRAAKVLDRATGDYMGMLRR